MENYSYTPPKNLQKSSEELLQDLRDVADKIGTQQLSSSLYSKFGKYDVSTVLRRFGTWNKALKEVGLKPGNFNNYSDEELFENVLNIWQSLGRQPVRNDLKSSFSKISQGPYNRRFKTWSKALQSFINYANGIDIVLENKKNEDMEDKKKLAEIHR
jgi:hypothetical protein